MNLIIPMAGRGTRLLPQTLTTPKPLIEIAGKNIIQRIVNIVLKNSNISIKNMGFIISKPDIKIEEMLYSIGKKNSINVSVFYQKNPNGTAHAIYCAKNILKGPILVVFADTLFETKLIFNKNCDGAIFVKEVEDPRTYGVVKIGGNGYINDFVEKPKNYVSNLAIVGVYYLKDGKVLADEIKYILDNEITINGEYQITTALENMKNKNMLFIPQKIKNWFDFGTPKNLLSSHSQILKKENPKTRKFKNTKIHNPCYIAEDAVITNSVIGPNVSVGAKTTIKNANIKNSIIQANTKIVEANLNNSIIGNHVEYNQGFKSVNIGDYSTFKK